MKLTPVASVTAPVMAKASIAASGPAVPRLSKKEGERATVTSQLMTAVHQDSMIVSSESVKRRNSATSKTSGAIVKTGSGASQSCKQVKSFSSHAQRRLTQATERALALLSILPAQAEAWMLGERSEAVSAQDRQNLMVKLIVEKGGPDGSVTMKAARSWKLLAAKQPIVVFPTPASLVATIVREQLERAMKSAKGLAGGRTVGNTIRDGFLFLEKVIGMPLAASSLLVETAAKPPPDALPRSRRHHADGI